MLAGHLLLGRPWQLNSKATHDGFRNCYKVNFKSKTIVLNPLRPIQAYEDQLKISQDYKQSRDLLDCGMGEKEKKESITLLENQSKEKKKSSEKVRKEKKNRMVGVKENSEKKNIIIWEK